MTDPSTPDVTPAATPTNTPSVAVAFATAATQQARLGIPAERLPGLVAAAAPVHEALRRLAEVDLGEVSPASSFDPAWD